MVSIINLCYNTGARLLVTLDSIKGQTCKNFEIIIADDCSTDDSVELLQKWIKENPGTRTKLSLNKKNSGIPASLNKALPLAEGKYLMIIGDDVWYPDLLATQLPLLEAADEKVALVFSKAACYNVGDKTYAADLDPLRVIQSLTQSVNSPLTEEMGQGITRFKTPALKKILLQSNIVIVFTALIRIDLVRKEGGFNENYFIEDYPLWMKLANHYDFIYIDKPMAAYMRYYNNFTTHSNWKVDASILKLLIDSFDNNLEVPVKHRLQNRILNNLLGMVRTAGKNRNRALLRILPGQVIKFLFLPGASTFIFFGRKMLRKAGLQKKQ